MNDLGPIIFPNLGGLQLNPPNSFSIGGFEIFFYGVIIAFGLVLAVTYGLRRSKQFGLRQDDILDGVLFIVPIAIICARLYYVFSEWDMYLVKDAANKTVWSQTFMNIINIRKGGLAIYGGVIGAAVSIVVFAKIKKISLAAVLDIVAIGFLLGQAIGRWGNFMNREAFGSYCNNFLAMRVSEARLDVPLDAGPALVAQKDYLTAMAKAGGYEGFIQVHPTFLYESVWNAVGFVALHFLSKKRQYDGQMALGYVAWYGLGRAMIEGLRMDSLYWGPFRASQLLAAVTCVAAVVVLVLMCAKKHDPAKLFVNRVAAMTENPAEEMEPAESAEEPVQETEEEPAQEPEEEQKPEEAQELEEEQEPGEPAVETAEEAE